MKMKSTSKNTVNPATIAEWKAEYEFVTGLIHDLIDEGALFLSTGIGDYVVIENHCFSLTLSDIPNLHAFLLEREGDYVEPRHSSVFWGMFLDTVRERELVFLPGRLWELGDRNACAELLVRAPIFKNGSKAIVLQIAKRWGDKLSKNI